ncbi:MAG: heterodisulfide reductase-related iron-sulfur binding cluster, partial [Dehalococcoidales bacterium]
AEAAIDSVENPTVLDDLLRTIGATPVDFPFATECCGSFEIVSDPVSVSQRTREIVEMAVRQGAEAIVVSCPLCCHNLGERQADLATTRSDFQPLPIVYFSQMLALALGVDPAVCRFDLNFGDAEAWLAGKGLLTPVS